MCRLMAFVSAEKQDFLSMAGKDFPEFIALSSFHKDGWGIALNSAHEADVLVLKAPESASQSQAFAEKIHALRGDGGLLHLRWATSGLENCPENTHPFVYEQYSFIHNGDIRPRENLDPFIRADLNASRIGETDSERYFYLLLTEIEKLGIEDAVQSAVQIIEKNCSFSSINAMLLSPEKLIVISKFNSERIPAGQPSDYYQLKYKTDGTDFVVASSGWPQSGWTPIENSTLLIVDRDTHKVILHTLN